MRKVANAKRRTITTTDGNILLDFIYSKFTSLLPDFDDLDIEKLVEPAHQSPSSDLPKAVNAARTFSVAL